jgi:hypothetical protein
MKGQDAGLTAAAHRDKVAFDHRVLTVVGHRVEVQIERLRGQQLLAQGLLVEGGHQRQGLLMRDPAGRLRQEALLGDGVQPGEQRQPGVGHQRHDMALALEGPQLQGQARAQGMGRGDHLGAGQAADLGQHVQVQSGQQRQEQKQATAARVKAARGQREPARIGHRLDGGADSNGPLLVQAPRQRGKALGLEHLTHRGGAERQRALLERVADLVDRVIGLAQLDDEIVGGGLLGLMARAGTGGDEELRLGVVAEVVTQNLERAGGVAKGASDLGGRDVFDEVSAQGLVLALLGRRRLEEEARRIAYVKWLSVRHLSTVLH